MTPEQFVYWLQGYFELREGTEPLNGQMKVIHDHLQTVFKKETPKYPMPKPNMDLTPGTGGTPGLSNPWTTPPSIIC